MSVQDCTIFCTLVGRLTFTESDCGDLETRFARDCTCADDPIGRAGSCLPSLCTPAQVAAVEAGETARCGTSSALIADTSSVTKRAAEAFESQAGSGGNITLIPCNHSAVVFNLTRPDGVRLDGTHASATGNPIGTTLLFIVGVIIFVTFMLGRGRCRGNPIVSDTEAEGGLLPVKQAGRVGLQDEYASDKDSANSDIYSDNFEV